MMRSVVGFADRRRPDDQTRSADGHPDPDRRSVGGRQQQRQRDGLPGCADVRSVMQIGAMGIVGRSDAESLPE